MQRFSAPAGEDRLGRRRPVSNVLLIRIPHEQNHLSSLRGDQPQSGQRIRGIDSTGFLSSLELALWNYGRIVSDRIHPAVTELRSQRKFLSPTPRSGLPMVHCERTMEETI